MSVLRLIDEMNRHVPADSPFGTRWKSTCAVKTPLGTNNVAMAARIDLHGRRREQYWFDDIRLERAVLLRLTCIETQCPHAVQVHRQWQAHQRRNPSKPGREAGQAWHPMVESGLAVGRHQVVARPAIFPCYTRCPHDAHPPITIRKAGFDLFDDGICLGGGVVELNGERQPRLPDLRAAEAYLLARHLETMAALATARDASRPDASSAST